MAKIKRLVVKNLNNWGEKGNFDLTFHDGLNIFTGQNGCGKTTLMKLMWYVLSGSMDFTTEDIYFDKATLELLDENEKSIIFKFNRDPFKARMYPPEATPIPFNQLPFEYLTQVTQDEKTIYDSNHRQEGIMSFFEIRKKIKTCFFPTFRRFEGGFNKYKDKRLTKQLNESLEDFSKKMSSGSQHYFITAFSASDLKSLITTNYAILAEKANAVEDKINDAMLVTSSNPNGDAAVALATIQQMIADKKEQKAAIMHPYTKLSNLIEQLFKEKGVFVQQGVTLGAATEPINIDKLSAGEKQMLSFLTYNAFMNDAIIFIDEPEMSLHPDWQSLLIPMLFNQNGSNQFFMATHSPFIYTGYTDLEHILDANKGNQA